MKVIKVLGIGSPFGDDQAGWKVANALKHQLSKHPHLAPFLLIENHDRPGVRLIELMSGFNTVFIIDAVKSGSAIGSIHRFKNESILDSENRFSTHGISILQTLHLARALDELPADLLFYGIEIDAITLDETLSPQIEKAIAEVTRRLINDLVTAYEA
ncbi:hydrogenase maturation protease [Legionella cherrii]|uniref:Hydrogenase expression/formation protein n=1 Tax=Legionella cherrii TaxID=28084 RepID=A0A0W0SAZ8_9GAMM|nr:hydrogenase maturation protease [Legionella cherrii]KTC80305.1 hydrogenase expression/formation protein [Legionella cherrii]VEB38883.1 hydrogenase expression/formation protein [Legionella cherrii]